MLSEAERRDLEEELRHSHAPSPKAAVLEALKVVQRHRGWVPDEAIDDLAAALGVPAAEIDGVASFYNLIHRRPVGDHVILVCDSASCWIMGQEPLLARLQELVGVGVGGTSADGRFTVLGASCLGACDKAPVLIIDEDLHERVRPGELEAILARYPARGGARP